jgi:hypothetical protein
MSLLEVDLSSGSLRESIEKVRDVVNSHILEVPTSKMTL